MSGRDTSMNQWGSNSAARDVEVNPSRCQGDEGSLLRYHYFDDHCASVAQGVAADCRHSGEKSTTDVEEGRC